MDYTYTKGGERFWRMENVELRRKSIFKGVENSKVMELPNHLRTYLELEVKDQKYARLMTDLHASLKKLWQEHR
jgi:hypothetical protein